MPQSPSIPLILLHGLLSSPQEFGLITLWLRNNGVDLFVPEMPGYTLATDIKSPAWKNWRDTACQQIDRCGQGDEPVILGGLCMGGVLAAAAAMKTRRKIAGLILMSPTFVYNGWGLAPITHLRHLAYKTGIDRFFSVKEREPYGVKNQKIRNWVIREMEDRASSAVGPSRIPLRALREGERMMAHVRQALSELDCPLLIMHAREDEITTLESVQAMFDALPVRDKELVVFENSYHMITIDNDRHEVARKLKSFVTRVTADHALGEPGTNEIIAADH